jgi:hypothetical protein
LAVDRAKRRALGRAAVRYLRRVKASPRDPFRVVNVARPTAPPVVRHVE